MKKLPARYGQVVSKCLRLGMEMRQKRASKSPLGKNKIGTSSLRYMLFKTLLNFETFYIFLYCTCL